MVGLGNDLIASEFMVKRSSSMSATQRKKSFAEGNRFKTFKTFVESKILSKSNRSLDDEEEAGKSNGRPVGANQATPRSVLAARDNFMRRSSRTSFNDIDMVKPFLCIRHFLCPC